MNRDDSGDVGVSESEDALSEERSSELGDVIEDNEELEHVFGVIVDFFERQENLGAKSVNKDDFGFDMGSEVFEGKGVSGFCKKDDSVVRSELFWSEFV